MWVGIEWVIGYYDKFKRGRYVDKVDRVNKGLPYQPFQPS